jgi:hypothetical protein
MMPRAGRLALIRSVLAEIHVVPGQESTQAGEQDLAWIPLGGQGGRQGWSLPRQLGQRLSAVVVQGSGNPRPRTQGHQPQGPLALEDARRPVATFAWAQHAVL